MATDDDILDSLMAVIRSRKASAAEQTSYTAQLLAGGVDKIAAKIREEADELIEAAREPGDDGRRHFIDEAADLLYHTLVLLGWRDVQLDEVRAELARRFGVSGIAEKAARRDEK